MEKFTGVKNVFLDVDDTLWENNIFFNQSMDWLCGEGRKMGHTDRATIALLEGRESFNIAYHGYGYGSYERSLIMAVRQLVARSGNQGSHGGIMRKALRWTHFLRNHPIQWRPGVTHTLPQIVKRFNTVIITKGHFGDQMDKVLRSGLRNIFHGVEVVPHKHEEDYERVLAKYSLKAEDSVMVGNSPRSDINMPKRVGIRTVFIPHPQTWHREDEPIEAHDPPTIQIKQFDELLQILEP